MTRIAVAGFQHETNTFAPFPTTIELFEQRGGWPELVRGAALFKRFETEHSALGLHGGLHT